MLIKPFRHTVPGSVTKTQLNNMFTPQRVTVFVFSHSNVSISFQYFVLYDKEELRAVQNLSLVSQTVLRLR